MDGTGNHLPWAADGVEPGDVHIVFKDQVCRSDGCKGAPKRMAREVQLAGLTIPIKLLDFLTHSDRSPRARRPKRIDGVLETLKVRVSVT